MEQVEVPVAALTKPGLNLTKKYSQSGWRGGNGSGGTVRRAATNRFYGDFCEKCVLFAQRAARRRGEPTSARRQT